MVSFTLKPSIKMPSALSSTRQEQLHYSVTFKQLKDINLYTLHTLVCYKFLTVDLVLVILTHTSEFRISAIIVLSSFEPKWYRREDHILSTT